MLNHLFPFWMAVAAVVLLSSILLPVMNLFQSRENPTVTVYAAQDQVYAEPILKDFEKQTGINVRAVYDSEATKTVAIANRLLAERKHPQCDVYWGNEELRTRQLASKEIFRETNGWAAFGYRTRRIVVSAADASTLAPASLIELTNPIYHGQLALAYPLFGSTATHLLALRQHWGHAAWESWCRALAANKPLLVDGNSVAARMVSKGQVKVGLTDSDDIAAENREGANLKALPIFGETLLLPNTAAVIRNAPHPEAAQRLFEHLQTRAVTERLIQAGALEGALAADVWSSTLKPDWEALLGDLETGTRLLQNIFLR